MSPEPLLPALERLGAEVERVARGAEAEAPHRRRDRRAPHGRTLLTALAATATLATAAAVAATTGLLTGAPVSNPQGIGFTDPHRGWGVPITKTIKVAPLRVADPDGGLPWGIRTFVTTRHLGCVQVGRVQDGQLGVIGQDGAFNNDGKFHIMGPGIVTGAFCAATDGADHTFLSIVRDGLPASGLERGCSVWAIQARPTVTPCPDAHERILVYGVLGPAAKSVTYRAADGSVATQRVTGPEGAYLVVTRPSRRYPATGTMKIGRVSALRLLSIRYRDGSVCHATSPIRHNGARGCPAKGYVAPSGPALTTADVATRVTATPSARPVAPQIPGVTIPKSAPKQRRLTIRFHARVASVGLIQTYNIAVVPRDHHRCDLGALSAVVDHDVVAGEHVRQDLWLPPDCRGPIDVTVTIHQQRGAPDPFPPVGFAKGQPIVGRAQAHIP